MQAASVLRGGMRLAYLIYLLPVVLFSGLPVASVAAPEIPVKCDPTKFPAPPPRPDALSCDSPSYFLVNHLPYSATWTDEPITQLPFTHQGATYHDLPSCVKHCADCVSLAKSVLGAPYSYGGKGWDYEESVFADSDDIKTAPGYTHVVYDKETGEKTQLLTPGIDCAGLIFWACNKANGGQDLYDISNKIYFSDSDSQYRYETTAIDKKDLKPGDLLFFLFNDETGKQADHVAMFIGGSDPNRDVIQATSSVNCKNVVCETSMAVLTTKYEHAFLGYRRLKGPLAREGIGLEVKAHSPVNLAVTDPDGLTITADTLILTDEEALRAIPGELYYYEWGRDAQGHANDMVVAPTLKVGDYLIKVTVRSGALPTDTYSLEVKAAGTRIILAQHTPIRDIPGQGYGIRSTGTSISQFIPVPVPWLQTPLVPGAPRPAGPPSR